MNKIFDFLMASGFKENKNGGLSKELFIGYHFDVVPENGRWSKNQDLHLYLSSDGFGKLMNDRFSSEVSFFNAYKPRKLRSDTSGCLGMVLALLQEDQATHEKYLCSGNIRMTPKHLVTLLGEIDSCELLFDRIYKGDLGRLLVMIESLWVYLYLCKECNIPNEKILSQLEAPFMAPHIRRWRLNKIIDMELISTFTNIYL